MPASGRAGVSLATTPTLVDGIWAWRPDHGNSGTVGWTVNTAQHGLVVNGNNVLATGLFVQHAFEAPSVSGVQLHDLLTVSLGNVGVIKHVVNEIGAATPTNTTPSTVTTFP